MKEWSHEVYSGKKTIGDIEISGKRVFLRTDYNVPVVDNVITDDLKIRKTVDTIKFLLKRGVKKIVIGTHLGRPEVCEDPVGMPKEGGVRVVVERLNQILKEEKIEVHFEFEYIKKEETEKQWAFIQNLRTLKIEKDGKDKYSKELLDSFIAKNCDVMVSDGFGVLHRKDYSVVGLPIEKVSGLLVDSEMQGVSFLLQNSRPVDERSPTRVMRKDEMEKFVKSARSEANFKMLPERPVDLLIIGGCKLEDKIGLVKNLLGVASNIFLGGLLATPFDTKTRMSEISEIAEVSLQTGSSILLPIDYVMESMEVVSAKSITEKNIGKVRDIGPQTEKMLEQVVMKSARVFWNGTLGMVEKKEFAHGTEAVLNAIRERKEELAQKKERGMICAGGGDTSGYIYQRGFASSFDYVFTGGGATLEALEGKVLPGVEALSNRTE